MGLEQLHRRAARLVVINRDGRVCLFQCNDPQQPLEQPFWLTPGGGVEPGEEDLRMTACRELLEETGHRVQPSELIGPIAICEGSWEWRGQPIYSVDTYFALRVDNLAVDYTNQDPIEAEILGQHGWLSPDEMDASELAVVPKGLAQLVRDLMARSLSDTPRVLEW
ncbi:MAG: NUDIX domain-containing protein [Actinobacteria bacterium]|nr:NUDIX domain-containing protein [Actinomycetota bacterium]